MPGPTYKSCHLLVGDPNDCVSSTLGSILPVTINSPSTVVAPVILVIAVISTVVPVIVALEETVNVVPLNVKFALSSNNPSVPDSTILLLVKLLIVALVLTSNVSVSVLVASIKLTNKLERLSMLLLSMSMLPVIALVPSSSSTPGPIVPSPVSLPSWSWPRRLLI